MEVTETFPGVSQWQKFGEACEKAEGYRDLALEEAERKLDKLVNSIPGWTVCATLAFSDGVLVQTRTVLS